MSSKLFRGSKILALERSKKSHKLLRSQTAKQAANTIRTKYGKIEKDGEYYHSGKGNWVQYSEKRDRRRNTHGKKYDDYARRKHQIDFI
jgi:hypothetical protein